MASAGVVLQLRFVRIITDGTHLLKNNSSRWTLCKNQFRLSFRPSSSAVSKEEKQPIPDPPLGSEDAIDKLKSELEKLTKGVATLEERNRELDDKYKRALAESDNMRKRMLKQVEDAKLYGIQGFCKDLLEVSDILGTATDSVPRDEVKNNNPHLKNLYEGLLMTEAQLQKVFKLHGLMPVNPLNEKFDPNMHEALFQQESGEKAGTIVYVSKIGYKLHDRVIRPALVGVSKGS